MTEDDRDGSWRDRSEEALGRSAAELQAADEHYVAGRLTKAGAALGRALGVAFERGLHFDATASALAEDPVRFVELFASSVTAQAVRSERGRLRRRRPERAPGLPMRVLVVVRKNMNFLGEIRGLLDDSPGLEGRLFSFADAGDIVAEVAGPGRMANELLTGKRRLAERAEQLLRPHLEWADVVFVEWCTAHAVVFNMVDPRDTRVVLRLHSYEAFTPWPHLIDFGRVDDLLFVSDHLRDFTVHAVPALREAHAPRLAVLPLSLQLGAFDRPKAPGAQFTLGVVGWGSVAKDPLWALEVLRRLREVDPRYRLVLIGHDFDSTVSATAAGYGRRLDAELEPLEAEGAVQRLGHTGDVPSALTQVGVILSSSVRESFHAGLVEGAASGAVPVVRDWPYFAGRETSARTLFPPEWVVGTPEEAAQRIVDATATDESWRRVRHEAARHAVVSWDWQRVRGDYVRFLTRDWREGGVSAPPADW